MLKVTRLKDAVQYYRDVFGLQPLWQDATSVGLQFPDSDSEIVLHTNSKIPRTVDVNYLVEDVPQALAHCIEHGCTLIVEPFEIPIGTCAVIEDPFGQVHSILDMSKGPRTLVFDESAVKNS